MADVNINDKANISFECPKCLKGKILRTRKQRKTAMEYTCPLCEFVGP